MGSKVTDEGGARKKRRAEFYKVLSKMQKSLVYKPAQVIWCCSSMIVVNLGFPCLYSALSVAMVVVRQSRFKTFFLGGQILLSVSFPSFITPFKHSLTPTARSGCGLYSLVYSIKRKMCPGKNDVFSFVLCARGTPSLALLIPKMQRIIVYISYHVTWCCSSMIVAVLCYECLYNAFYLCSSKF